MKMIVLLIAAVAQNTGWAEHRAQTSHDDYLVGIYYFAGWWQKSPNKRETGGRDWRPDYPDRARRLRVNA